MNVASVSPQEPAASAETSPDCADRPGSCQAIASTMIVHFVTRLEVEARKSGGRLTAQAIRAIADRFLNDEQVRFQPVFQRSFEQCGKARESQRWESARSQPFDRVFMKNFSELFPPRHGDDGERGVLSRRMIPGFKVALMKMIGPELYEQCQGKTRLVVERHGGGAWRPNWDKIHSDPEIGYLITDVLILMAHHFTNYVHRRTWFMDMINNRLPAPAADDPDPRWRMTEHNFAEMMRALYADLRSVVHKNPTSISERYGAPILGCLKALFTHLDAG